jgi:GATA-binding protein, other eukaryote
MAAKLAQEQAQAESTSQSKATRPALGASKPSGIAQLRKTSEANVPAGSDPMNLDDFIVPTSVASPAGLPTPSSTEHTLSSGPSSLQQQQTVPINAKQRAKLQQSAGPAASVPKNNADFHSRFDGIPKRVRKTSIDERRSVSVTIVLAC